MALKLADDTEKRLVASIKRFFEEEMDEPIGDLNERVADLSGSKYEAESDYWKK